MPANRIKIDNAILKRYKKQAQRAIPHNYVCKILIVCEGKKTEPNYFMAFPTYRKGTFVYNVEVEGMGCNTLNVVDKAIELRNRAKGTDSEYDCVWAVFDRDSFPAKRFNSAIIKARDNHIECAWSNEAFEQWYLYHFHNRVTPMRRGEYRKAISEAVNRSPLYTSKKRYTYTKGDKENYYIMTHYGSQRDAIERARKSCEAFTDNRFAEHNPCTRVYLLVLQLIGEDEVLNRRLIESQR